MTQEKQQAAPHGMVALQGEGEARRNRLLRRLDWRFLAGRSRFRCAVVQGLEQAGTLREALGLAAGQVQALEQALPAQADLAVLANPGPGELARAWQALEPGGLVYVEWTRPRPGGAAAVRGRLERAGFTPAFLAWAYPWAEQGQPAFWLPVESAAGVEFFLRSRPQPESGPARLRARALQTAWRAAWKSGLLAPLAVGAYKPLLGGGLPEHSLERRAQAGGLDPAGEGLDWLLLTGGLHSTNKITALAFSRGGGQTRSRPVDRPGAEDGPAAVVKLPRRELSLASLEREAQVLQVIQAGRERPLEGVPRLIFQAAEGDFPAIGETYLPGVPLYTRLSEQTLPDLARQAAAWAAELVEAGPPRPAESWHERLVDPWLEEFSLGYAEAGGADLAARLRRELDRLPALPLAVEHGDFSPWNVLITPTGELAVLDWEGADPHGLPLTDLVYFLAYLAFFAGGDLDRGEAPAAYRRLLDPETRAGRAAAECQAAYLARTGLPGEAVRPLRLLTWLRHSVLEKRLLENSSAGAPDPVLLRRGLHLALLRIELDEGRNG
jgi:aminoglycoside phosphotransferase (APT) family kinase protein